MSAHVFAEDTGKLTFVGNFEALYAAEHDPWFQSAESGAMARYYDFSRKRLVEALRPHRTGSGLEIGCGHGHLTAYLQKSLCVQMTGIDIAQKAVEKAQELHRQRFLVSDIIGKDFEPPGSYAFVLWAQMLWYVLHEIDRALENSLRCVEPGGLLVISQAFLANQRYGREIADGFEGAVDLFRGYDDRLRLIEARYDDSERHVHRDGLLIFRVL